jgi:hypothetical protein
MIPLIGIVVQYKKVEGQQAVSNNDDRIIFLGSKVITVIF